MEFHIDSESLIFAVRDRPYLYDYSLPDYSSKAKKVAGWLEICEEILPNWRDLDPEEKDYCELELQKKWRNMRDSFTKEYKKQTLAGIEGRRPPRPYLYYEALSFLEPIVKRRHSKIGHNITLKKELNCTPVQTVDDLPIEAEYLNDENAENIDSTSLPSFHQVILENMAEDESSKEDDKPDEIVPRLSALKHNINNKAKKPKLTENICNLTLAIKKSFDNDIQDSDERFLLSLAPYFKSFDQNQKLRAQREILEIIKQRMDDVE